MPRQAAFPSSLRSLTGFGFVGLQSVLAGNIGSDGAIWWARHGDLRRWRRISTGSTFRRAQILDLETKITSQGNFVAMAVGDANAVAPDRSQIARATAWFSADGRTWHPSAPDARLDGIAFIAVSTWLRGYYALAAPADRSGASCGTGCHGQSGVWWSSNGRSWKRVLRLSDSGVVVSGFASITDPAAPGGEDLVVLGGDRSGGLLWRTSDGRSWRSIREPAFAGATLTGLEQTSAGFLAFGRRLDGAAGPAVWILSDAKRWQPVPGSAPANVTIASGSGLGPFVLDPGPGGSAGIWASVDGTTWVHQPVGSATPTSLIRWSFFGDGPFLAVGRHIDSGIPAWLTGFPTG